MVDPSPVGVSSGASLFRGTASGIPAEVVSIADGTLRTVRVPRSIRRLTRDDITSFVAAQLARRAGRADTASLRQLYGSLQYPPALPPYRRVLVDAVDRIWIEDYSLPADRTVRWTILGVDGRVLAVLDSPSNFEILEIDRDAVRGLWRDEMGVQWIREYQIARE